MRRARSVTRTVAPIRNTESRISWRVVSPEFKPWTRRRPPPPATPDPSTLRPSTASRSPTRVVAARVARGGQPPRYHPRPSSYTHLRAHETVLDLVCRLLLEKKKKKNQKNTKLTYKHQQKNNTQKTTQMT